MSSQYIGIEDARKVLGDLVTAAQQGADIILTRNRRPVARLTRYQEDTVTMLATVTETRDATGGTIGVDECRDGSVIASPWTRDMTPDEAESREWDAILADAGWTVTGKWEDHDGYWTAEVERAAS